MKKLLILFLFFISVNCFADVEYGNTKITVTTGGNVGVATATPQRELSVVGDLQVTGNIFLTGTITGTGASHATVFGDSNGSDTVITTANTWVTQVLGATLATANTNVSHDSGVLTVDVTGNYLLNWDCSFSGSNLDVLGVGMSLNNADPTVGLYRERTIGAAGALGNLAGSHIVSLTATNTLRMKIRNATDTDDMMLKHWAFTIHKISE